MLIHAIYTLSDPREVILKEFAKKLSDAEGFEKEFELYDRIERLAKELITNGRNVHKPVCANVDFYSGFVWQLLLRMYATQMTILISVLESNRHNSNVYRSTKDYIRCPSSWLPSHTSHCED